MGRCRPKVINLMRIAQPSQVMLEVKVAEISKTLLDRLGSAIQFTPDQRQLDVTGYSAIC